MSSQGAIFLYYISATLGMTHPLYWRWNYRRFAHILLVGATGSGKTVAALLLAARCAKHIPGCELTVCDAKALEWQFLRDCERYYEFSACMDGLNAFYNILLARQQGIDSSRTFQMLIFDEFSSFLNSLSKKDAEEAKTLIATLLMLGRAYNIHVCIVQQRGDSEYFSKARDNFSIVVGMGNLSKEQKSMLMQEVKEDVLPIQSLGGGYVVEDSTKLFQIQVPWIASLAAMQDVICGAVGYIG